MAPTPVAAADDEAGVNFINTNATTSDELSNPSPPPLQETNTMSISKGKGFQEEFWKDDNDDVTILQFLDSMDEYLTLNDSLSSTLRQGWLDLTSARHSMGSLRISNASFDLKEHPASSVVQVNESTNETLGSEPHFTLRKWGFCENRNDVSKVEEDSLKPQKKPLSTLVHRNIVHESQETSLENRGNLVSVDDHVQKERSKALTMFGALVSPKLRSSQLSFEEGFFDLLVSSGYRRVMVPHNVLTDFISFHSLAALETLVGIANARSRMLSAFYHLERKKEGSNC